MGILIVIIIVVAVGGSGAAAARGNAEHNAVQKARAESARKGWW